MPAAQAAGFFVQLQPTARQSQSVPVFPGLHAEETAVAAGSSGASRDMQVCLSYNSASPMNIMGSTYETAMIDAAVKT